MGQCAAVGTKIKFILTFSVVQASIGCEDFMTNIDHEDWKLSAGAYNPFPEEMSPEEQAAYELWIENEAARDALRAEAEEDF